MRTITRVFWGTAIGLALLWLAAEPVFFRASGLFAWRGAMVQLTGILAIGAMSLAMVLALRPRWPEAPLGGLDKMYRLHKWLGIGALAASVLHWLWAQGPKWAVGWGWLARPARGARPAIGNPLEALFAEQRGLAEALGEWAFYVTVALIALALLPRFPYRLFFKSHRLLAVAYLVLAAHAVVLLKFAYWTAPVGWATAALLAGGVWAAAIVLLRRVGAGRRVPGEIVDLHYYPGVRALETTIAVPDGWPGHKPGQFAFAMSDRSEGAHPYTIASDWRDDRRTITFITKALGDHTRRLPETLHIGQAVTVEGPYGCFTFDDDCPRQIWIGGGIGITPFVARMKQLAARDRPDGTADGPGIDLFHTTADVDDDALARLAADAASARIRLHLLIDARDGYLTGERIRAAVPEWREASLWFCGPAGFGAALRRDFAAHGFPVERHFHQELFALR